MNDLIPATSPLLRPSDRHRNSTDSFSLTSIRNDDIPEDLEFLAPGHWSDSERDFDEENEDEDDDDSIEDFSLEDGHIAGVPSCSSVFNAKQYHTSEFRASLLELLRDDLRVLGWANLPADLPASLIKIHKVSGSLTNAVFFVSIPAAEFEINNEGAATPLFDSGRPATVLSELERGRGTATPKPDHPVIAPGQKITIEAPTLLLRVYGPSSGALISRRTELHILHTLSATYAIGPRVLGTFANGRVEEYFHSRALHKEEMRDARISRWIGRRMRELHRVELEQMIPPDDGNKSRESSRSRSSSASSGGPERPSLEHMGAGSNRSSNVGGSGASIYSTSSGSSIFSFGTSYSASSQGSWSSARGGSSELGTTPMVESPLMMPQRYPSESRAESKKRTRYSLGRGRRSKDKLGVWENITRWTREAKLVLKQLDALAQTPGYDELLATSTAAAAAAPESDEHILPLASLARTLELRAQVNLPLFEQQIKLYRSFVRDWERAEGKSKRVFSHNDTQYGNLLLLTPTDEKDLERQLQAPHQKIIVVDFEYSGPNPRGFDIANHFIEWQADYHHPTLSHSLADHDPYPTASERARFLRAYVGCDGGLDTSEPNPSTTEDARVQRLEDEVKIWEPSSHAMWAVWGIVQAKEDLTAQVEKWKKACARKVAQRGGGELEKGVEGIKLEDGKDERPKLRRGKSGELVDGEGKEVDEEKAEEEEVPVVDFDYLSYTLSRLTLFRHEVKKLGIIS